jgi:hypothetical protein
MVLDSNLLIITLDEEVANVLSGQGLAVTFWDKDLMSLKLKEDKDKVYVLLSPAPFLGIALAWLRQNPFARIWVPSDIKLKLPWWASAKKIAIPLFTVPIYEISFNPKADLRNYLRK